MSGSAQVTVAVVSWNTRELLARCLRALEADAHDGLAEVWVVDNASEDGSAGLAEREFPWARLVASEANLGFGKAVNVVARETATPYLAMANADAAPEPGALRALLAAAERDPRAGAVAPQLVRPDGTVQHSVFPFPGPGLFAAFNLGAARVVPGLGDRLALMGHWDSGRPRRVPWAIGAFLLVRREAWDRVGGFDEEVFMYAEDLDLGWRLRRAGWRTRYEPGARVRHDEAAATEQAWGPERTVRWQRSTYAWMLRRRGALRTRLAAAVNLAGAAGRYAVLAPLALLAPRRLGPRRDAARGWVRAHATGFAPRGELEEHR